MIFQHNGGINHGYLYFMGLIHKNNDKSSDNNGEEA